MAACAADGGTAAARPVPAAVLVRPPALLASAALAASALLLSVPAALIGAEQWGTQTAPGHCEGAAAVGWTRQPINAWSSLVYVAVGGWALGQAWESGRSGDQRARVKAVPESQSWLLGVLTGISCSALGLGSFFFHASLRREFQQLDVAAIFWVMGAAALCAFWRAFCLYRPATTERRWLLPIFIAVALLADAALFQWKWQLSTPLVFALQVLLILLGEGLCLLRLSPERRRRNSLLIAFAAAAFAVGFLLSRLGEWHAMQGTGGSFCEEGGAFQPHAVWHLITSAALRALHELQLGPAGHAVREQGSCCSSEECSSEGPSLDDLPVTEPLPREPRPETPRETLEPCWV